MFLPGAVYSNTPAFYFLKTGNAMSTSSHPFQQSSLKDWCSQASQYLEPTLTNLLMLATQIVSGAGAILTLSDGQQHWCQGQHQWPEPVDPYWDLTNDRLEPIWLDAEMLTELPVAAAVPVKFYGGMPLMTTDQDVFGRLAVLSSDAIALTPDQRSGLQTLAQQIVHYLELQFYRHQQTASSPQNLLGGATADSFPCSLAHQPVTRDFYQNLCAADPARPLALCAVIENVDHGIIFCDRHGTLAVINQTARQLLRLPHTASTLNDVMPAVTLYYPGRRTPLTLADMPLSKGLAGEVQYDTELVIVHPDGQRYMVLVSSRPIYGPDQQSLGAVMSLFDITRRHQTETDLRSRNQGLKTKAHKRLEDLQAINQRLQEEIIHRQQAEATLRLFYELPFLGMATIASDTKTWLHFNDHLCEILGYRRDELQQLTWADLTHPDDLAQALNQFEQLAIGNLDTGLLETRFIRKDSLLVYASLEIKVVSKSDGKPDFFVTTIQDITERTLAETALMESENRFRATFEKAAVGIAHMAPDGVLLWLNPALSDILGYARHELMGQSLFDLIHPEDQAIAQHYIEETLTGQRQSYNHQQRYLCQDGSVVWAHITVSLVQDQIPKNKYLIVVLQDITLAKRAETTLQQYAHRLQGLHDIDQAILTNFKSQEVAQSALLLLHQLLQCSRGIIALFDRETHQGEILVEHDATEVLSSPPSASLDAIAQSPPAMMPLQSFVFADSTAMPQVKRIANLAQMLSRPQVLQQIAAPQHQAAMCIPLVESRQVVGEIILLSPQAEFFTPEHEEVAQEIANHLAIALQHARLFEQVEHDRARLHSLSSQLLEAQEAERRLLAHELHDEVGQALTAVKLNLHRLDRLTQSPKTLQPLQDSLHIVEGALQQIRNLSLDLRPSMLDDLGLLPALRWYINRHAERTGLNETLSCNLELRELPAPVETACFRIVQEALTNIARHAQAQTVNISLQKVDQMLQLSIQDDGIGFDLNIISQAKNEGTSLGLIGMEERGMLIGGCLKIASAPGLGTTVSLTVPLT